MLFTHIPIDAFKQTYYTDNTACATLDKIVKFFHPPPPAQRKRGKKRSLKTLGHNSSKQENTTFYIDWVC